MNTLELRKKTCCFTGHRKLPKGKIPEIAERTADEIRRLIGNNGVHFFGVGGAIGYDTLAAEVLFQLREKEFPSIKVILVYPFDGYTNRWTPEQKADHKRQLPQYDKLVCVCNRSSREAYLIRNRYLVDGSAYCISYCTRDYGGTAYTVRYARQQGVTVCNVGLEN